MRSTNRQPALVAGIALVPALLLAAVAPPATAQTSATPTPARHSIWMMYGGDHAVASRFALVFDSQLRLTQDGDRQRQLLLRPGVSFAVTDRAKLSAGYAIMAARDDANDPLTPHRPEHRAWVSAQLGHTLGPVALAHRYRMEHRWLSGVRVDDAGLPLGEAWVTAERMRYSLRGSVPVAGRGGNLYVTASDEVFASFGGYAGDVAFDQNRATLALGMRATRALRLELGYMLQSSAGDDGRLTERNHTLVVAAISTAALRR